MPDSVERIVLEAQGVLEMEIFNCSSCGQTPQYSTTMVWQYRTSHLQLDFVMPGWLCDHCGSQYFPKDCANQINRFIDDRLVKLGRRPAVNPDTVARMKSEQAAGRAAR